MRLMLLHFEHSHDFSLKSAFDKLKSNCDKAMVRQKQGEKAEEEKEL